MAEQDFGACIPDEARVYRTLNDELGQWGYVVICENADHKAAGRTCPVEREMFWLDPVRTWPDERTAPVGG